MKLNLVVLTPGATQGKIIPITRTPFVIGRDPKCHLRPSSPLVSNRHCSVEVRNGKVVLADLGSTNGTLINGQPIKEGQEVRDTDRLQIGPLSFGIRIERTPALDQQTPLPPTRASGKPEDDEAIAAMLLAAQDIDVPSLLNTTTLDGLEVPSGATEIKDRIFPPGEEKPASDSTVTMPAESGQPSEAKPAADKAKAGGESTSAVADKILQKYLRRPRSK